jgi:hypothetical protein
VVGVLLEETHTSRERVEVPAAGERVQARLKRLVFVQGPQSARKHLHVMEGSAGVAALLDFRAT